MLYSVKVICKISMQISFLAYQLFTGMKYLFLYCKLWIMGYSKEQKNRSSRTKYRAGKFRSSLNDRARWSESFENVILAHFRMSQNLKDVENAPRWIYGFIEKWANHIYQFLTAYPNVRDNIKQIEGICRDQHIMLFDWIFITSL